MEMWQARSEGYFFPRGNLSSAVQSKLEELILDDSAQILEGGILIPFEKSFALSEEDAELLNLPPRNPYQIAIRTEGYIGKSFKYVVELLDAQGRPVGKPQINGAIVQVGENLFRLNADQFALINLARLGNENSREEPLLTIKRLQQQATPAQARLDKYIADKKIIAPDKLGVDFQSGGDRVKVAPVLLESHDGKFTPIDSTDFQSVFDKRNRISGVYKGRSGAQYVFSETLRDGLAQIKSVGTLSKADAARYKLQPRELFTGEAFDFDYSDRVIGTEEIKIGGYQNFSFGIDWGEGGVPTDIPEPPTVDRPRAVALKIKENFEQIDYATGLTARQGKFFADVLKSDVTLKPWQIKGVWYISQLWLKGWRGILVADDMGLGKTLQTLTFIAGLKRFGGVNQPILIVAPTALLANWQAEYRKFLQENIFDAVIPLHGDALRKFLTDELTPNGRRKLSLRSLPPNVLALTTYETLRDYQFSFAEIPWACIISDETQKIKNPDAGLTKALKAMKYDFAICLSGTPVENSWVDLWSIMDFVQPAHLDDLKTFRSKYVEGLTGDNVERLGEELKGKLKPLLLRRMKDGNLQGLPAKHVELCREEMPPYQAQIYSAVLERYRRGGFASPLNFINTLRGVCLHPDLAALSKEKFSELDADEVINRSARLIKTFALLRQIKIRGEKALIFVTNRKAQSILKRLLEEKFGIRILPPINGTMNGAARQGFIDEFRRSGGFNVLILSPEAAGVGFTITEANNVIHLERTWNPAKENQATDRAYRIGQNKAVNVYLPFAVNSNLRGKTFDENLETLLSYKRNLSANILFPTAEIAADTNTLAEMLKPPPDEILDTSIWTIEAIDAVTGLAFEQIIADLFNGTGKFAAEKTPDTNDFGADVAAKSLTGNAGLLIQCKHVDKPDCAIGNKGVQEICAAVACYSDKFKCTFQPAVVTNARAFTKGAVKLAAQNGVRLIARKELDDLFREYQIPRCL